MHQTSTKRSNFVALWYGEHEMWSAAPDRLLIGGNIRPFTGIVESDTTSPIQRLEEVEGQTRTLSPIPGFGSDEDLTEAMFMTVSQLTRIRELAREMIEDECNVSGRSLPPYSKERMEEYSQSLQAQAFNEVLSYTNEDDQSVLSAFFEQIVDEVYVPLKQKAEIEYGKDQDEPHTDHYGRPIGGREDNRNSAFDCSESTSLTLGDDNNLAGHGVARRYEVALGPLKLPGKVDMASEEVQQKE